MKSVLSCVLLTLMIGTATAQAYENSSVVGQVPDRVVITLKVDIDPVVSKASGAVDVDIPSLQALARQFEVKDMAPLYPFLGKPDKAGDPDPTRFWAVDFPETYDLETVRRAYEALPEVAQVQLVDICRYHDIPNDPGVASGQQYYLRNVTPCGKDVRAVGGWAESHGDTNIVIAICDSGVDWMHPDLGGSPPNYLDGAIWINWTEWYGTPGSDDDGNGFIDDFRGWDFVTGVTGYPDEDTNTPDNDPMDYESHGTNCAGCSAGLTDNGIGIAGVGWDCKVMALRVGWLPNGETIGVVRMDFAAQGMMYAAANGANIINCSWGSSSFLSFAVSSCVSAGCIIMTSAGNDNDEVASYLSGHPDVLSIAALNADDTKASFSSYGTWVELAAPGVNIYTTQYFRSSGTHGYSSVDGTSFSCPIACGCAALIWSANPGMSRTNIMSILRTTADDVEYINPTYVNKLGDGRPNLLAALGDEYLEVPDEFPELLDAMNEASPTDTITVLASHALTGGITVPMRDMTIRGGYAAGYGSWDPVGTPTVITAGSNEPALQFSACSGEAGTPVVNGFRCSGGTGTFFSDPFSSRFGGGVLINTTSPTLINIDVTGNTIGGSTELGCGGGIYLKDSTASLTNCKVHENGGIYGSGIFVYQGAPTLTGCEIYDNTSITDNFTYDPEGGGMYILDADVTLDGCRISGHDNCDRGGGIYADESTGSTSLALTGNEIYDNKAKIEGGGIYLSGTMLSMSGDQVYDNGRTADATFMFGGGMYVSGADVDIDQIDLSDNDATIAGGAYISGAASADLTNSLLTGNYAAIVGGAIQYDSSSGSISGNTVACDTALSSGGAGLYITSSSPIVSNNIVAFNEGGASFANGVYCGSGTPSVLCNDVYMNATANYGGTLTDQTGTNGNISADPEFCDHCVDFTINTTSPCAPAQSGGCGLIGAVAEDTCPSNAVPEDLPVTPVVFEVEQNYPNPFNPATMIRFSLPQTAHTTIKIYNVAGRLVRTLVDGRLEAKVHEVSWNGRNDAERVVAAGVYFYQVRSGKYLHTGQMALVK